MKSDRLPKEVQTEWTLNNDITDIATFMFPMGRDTLDGSEMKAMIL